jgi:hypothetical protein
MSFGQVLVLANENNGRNPKFLCLVLLDSIADDFSLTDVCARRVGNRVGSDEDIDSSLVEFLSCEKLIKFGAGSRDCLAGPVGDFGGAQTLSVSTWKKKFDSCGSHGRWSTLMLSD